MRAPAVLLVLLAAAPAAPVPPSRTALVAGKGLNEPFGVTFDAAGTLYIVEMGGNRVSVRGRGGRLSVLAGTGEKGLAGDGGPALQARMNGPKHISVDGEGAVLIADTENHGIRRYTPRDGLIRPV